MLFLIDYDRDHGRLVSLQAFRTAERRIAEEARLELELSLAREGIEREVVLLEADGEGALRLTHRRYFEGLAQFATEPGQIT